MNNPFQMLQAIRNPQQLIQGLMSNPQIANNPMAKNAMDMFKNKDIDGLKAMAENLCQEKGTTIEEVKNSIMQQFGK